MTSQPSAHLLLLQEAAAKKGSNEISDVITRLLAQLTGLAVLSVAGLGTLLVTAKDKNSLYKRTAGLFAVAALASLAVGIKSVIPKQPPPTSNAPTKEPLPS